MNEKIISQRDERLSQIPPETPLTQEQRFDLEAEVIRSVRRKEKIVKSRSTRWTNDLLQLNKNSGNHARR